jgi:Putative zinc-finger
MEHEDAIRTNAVEAYFLDDLTDDERDAFEEHYADCEECFAGVQTGATFTSTLQHDPNAVPVPVAPYRKVAFAAAASLVLSIGGLAYQEIAVVRPLLAQLSEPRIVPEVDLREPRDEEKTLTFERDARPSFIFSIPPDLNSPSYACKVVDARGRVQGKPVIVTKEQAGIPVNFDVGRRAPGNYTLIVSGSHGVPVLEKRFTVR